MIEYLDAVWNKQQLAQHLTRIAQLFRSEEFRPTAPFTSNTQDRWIELIRAVSDLVRQEEVSPTLPAGSVRSSHPGGCGERICITITN